MDGSFYNGHGGNPPMKNDYVTHEELNHAVDKLSNKMDLMDTRTDARFEKMMASMDAKFEQTNARIDLKFEQVNTKFAIQQVWFVMTAIAIISFTVTLIEFLK